MAYRKKKAGLERRDKFYHLAKEIGFRSRAAFKLIQLNRKFGFLDESKACLDLCAAPGGWSQVALKTMPSSGLIVGLDQDEIKSIGNGVTFIKHDLMADSCLSAIGRALKSNKVDVVLCDGAPHYGTDFKNEALIQNKLVLRALEVGSKFMNKNSWFVSKVARTQFFDSLISLIAQFFVKVSVTKPEASRSSSSECFIVCRGFSAPKKIDREVFSAENIFQKEDKIKPVLTSIKDLQRNNNSKVLQRLQHIPQKCSMRTFVTCDNYIDILAAGYQILIDDEEIANDPLTTAKIREFAKDLKMLNRHSIKEFLKYRKLMNQKLALKNKENSQIEVETESNLNEEENKDSGQEVKNLINKEKKMQKKLLKRAKKAKEKLIKKMVPVIEQNPDDLIFSAENYYKAINGETSKKEVENKPDEAPNLNGEQQISKKWLNNVMQKNGLHIDLDSGIVVERTLEINSKENTNSLEKETAKNPRKKQKKELSIEENAVAEMMVHSKKSKRDIEESSFNRHIYQDNPDDLPEWFVSDEQQSRASICSTLLADSDAEKLCQKYSKLRMKNQRISSKSLTKQAELKARRKRKVMNALQRTNVAAQNLIDDEFTPSSIKLKRMKEMYKKVLKKDDKKYIVTRRKHNGRMPKNVKGRFKLVDSRMKRDNWTLKAKKR
ncbi:MAG: pre-rRNA processing protein ftsj3 [Paramarteilia canceri]